jgi:glycosyltransferase involved in cell wall biosynthesis
MSAEAMTSASVALTTYNGTAYLAQQLESILAQSSLPDEIVISDDASADGTQSMIQSFQARSSVPIVLLAQASNIGIFENFCAALDHCQGEWIFYCDQDDVWMPAKVAAIQAALEPGVVLVTHQSQVCDRDLRPTGPVLPRPGCGGRYFRPVLASRVWGFGHQMMLHRRVWAVARALICTHQQLPAGQSGLSFVHNFDRLLICAAGLIGDVVTVEQPFTLFRRHSQANSPAGRELASKAAWHVLQAQKLKAYLDDLSCMDWLLIQPQMLESMTLLELADAKNRLKTVERLVFERYQIYTATSFWQRISAYWRSVRNRVYGGTRYPGHVQLKFALVDAWVACIIGLRT